MQVSTVSSMNFYGAKNSAAKKAAKVAKEVTPDFSKSAYAVPTGLQKVEKAAEAPFVGDYALINIQAPKATPNTNPASDYVAASMYIEPKKAADTKAVPDYVAASMHIEPKK